MFEQIELFETVGVWPDSMTSGTARRRTCGSPCPLYLFSLVGILVYRKLDIWKVQVLHIHFSLNYKLKNEIDSYLCPQCVLYILINIVETHKKKIPEKKIIRLRNLKLIYIY